ncbi:MAG TPA: hypothetical protein VJZ77_09290 [Blastocatellia bacterium]|nr:hypothetical protein [Blastocatellia bacterium]
MRKLNRQNNSIVDWRALRARKSHLDLYNEDLIQATGCSSRTVSAFFAGDEKMNLDTMIRLAAVMGLRPRITFEVVESDPAQAAELKAA